MTSTEYDAHQKRKNDGLNLKEQDKINSDNHKIITVTADTVSLLLLPLNDANIMFFRTKLNLHDFTFYNLKNKDVVNYLWSEVNGDLEASNFTSCYIAYLKALERNMRTLQRLFCGPTVVAIKTDEAYSLVHY